MGGHHVPHAPPTRVSGKTGGLVGSRIDRDVPPRLLSIYPLLPEKNRQTRFYRFYRPFFGTNPLLLADFPTNPVFTVIPLTTAPAFREFSGKKPARTGGTSLSDVIGEYPPRLVRYY